MEEKNYEAIVEAILFTVGESVELEKLANVLELDKDKTKEVVENLKKRYETNVCGVQIMELDGAYQMCTKAEYYEYLIRDSTGCYASVSEIEEIDEVSMNNK